MVVVAPHAKHTHGDISIRHTSNRDDFQLRYSKENKAHETPVKIRKYPEKRREKRSCTTTVRPVAGPYGGCGICNGTPTARAEWKVCQGQENRTTSPVYTEISHLNWCSTGLGWLGC